MLEYFLKKIEAIGYNCKKLESGGILIGFDCCPQWRIILQETDNDKIFPIFYYRQKRQEEVTDLHEIIPTLFSSITKSSGISSFRFLGEHNEFSGIEDELYGMYWFPAQPLNERIRKNNKKDFDNLYDIFMNLYLFHMYQGDILGVDDSAPEKFSFKSKELDEWVKKARKFIGYSESYIANVRYNPNWFFFSSYSSALSLINSPHICQKLKMFDSKKNTSLVLDGVTAKIEINNDIRTSISFKETSFAKNFFLTLGDHSEVIVITQENRLIFVSDVHFLIRYFDCGIESVSKEKELILLRQQKEISVLFGDRKFIWNIINGKSSAEFEDLTLELLEREPWVFSVKKVAPTNQGDNGRDLICEYDMLHHEKRINKNEESVKIGHMIVQCKTTLIDSKVKSIGKSSIDLADTLLHYRPDGYMLVVNTQITRDLTEMLETQKLRTEQNLINWWNSFDIEDRLRKNPDILSRYRNIVDYE